VAQTEPQPVHHHWAFLSGFSAFRTSTTTVLKEAYKYDGFQWASTSASSWNTSVAEATIQDTPARFTDAPCFGWIYMDCKTQHPIVKGSGNWIRGFGGK
jgi:hypothetical protein